MDYGQIPLIGSAAAAVTLWLLVRYAERAMYLIYRFLTYGSAEHEAVRDGHPSRAHLAGRHRPLKRWASRCQHCFQQYEEQRRQERRQARGKST